MTPLGPKVDLKHFGPVQWVVFGLQHAGKCGDVHEPHLKMCPTLRQAISNSLYEAGAKHVAGVRVMNLPDDKTKKIKKIHRGGHRVEVVSTSSSSVLEKRLARLERDVGRAASGQSGPAAAFLQERPMSSVDVERGPFPNTTPLQFSWSLGRTPASAMLQESDQSVAMKIPVKTAPGAGAGAAAGVAAVAAAAVTKNNAKIQKAEAKGQSHAGAPPIHPGASYFLVDYQMAKNSTNPLDFNEIADIFEKKLEHGLAAVLYGQAHDKSGKPVTLIGVYNKKPFGLLPPSNKERLRLRGPFCRQYLKVLHKLEKKIQTRAQLAFLVKSYERRRKGGMAPILDKDGVYELDYNFTKSKGFPLDIQSYFWEQINLPIDFVRPRAPRGMGPLYHKIKMYKPRHQLIAIRKDYEVIKVGRYGGNKGSYTVLPQHSRREQAGRVSRYTVLPQHCRREQAGPGFFCFEHSAIKLLVLLFVRWLIILDHSFVRWLNMLT